MGRKTDPKCLYCARNYDTEEEAQAKNPECYVVEKRVCYHKRYRIKNASKVNTKRRDNYAKSQGIKTIESILSDSLWVEVIVYGKRHHSVHAIGLKIYCGNELRFRMSPQHTLGHSMRDLKDYVEKIMVHLGEQYGIDHIGRYYYVDPNDCPICRGVTW